MKAFLVRIITGDSGQDLIEYALVAALIALAAIGAVKGLDNSIKGAFNGGGNSLTNALL